MTKSAPNSREWIDERFDNTFDEYLFDEDLGEDGFFAPRERIKDFIHQERQKARQDWLREEIVKLEWMKHVAQDKDGLLVSEKNYNQALQTIIDRYLLELNEKEV